MEFVIITGMSGAGKSRAVNTLEDMGYYCIDNMPPSMIPKFAEICFQSSGKIDRVAFVTDARGAHMFERFFEGLDEMKSSGYEYKMLFLDASDDALLNRYKETRRRHPFADMFGGRVPDAINFEREMLLRLRDEADYIIDTTSLTPGQLKDYLADLFTEGNARDIMINVVSFGFKYGVPPDGDLMFDVRCFPNPFYVEELKRLTGLDKPVNEFVMKSESAQIFRDKLLDLLDFMLPLYMEEDKSQLVVAIGCTGGKHRSVTFAELLYHHLKGDGWSCSITHRDIKK